MLRMKKCDGEKGLGVRREKVVSEGGELGESECGGGRLREERGGKGECGLFWTHKQVLIKFNSQQVQLHGCLDKPGSSYFAISVMKKGIKKHYFLF